MQRSIQLGHKADQHFYELDSLRGIAALVVLLNHFEFAYPYPLALWLGNHFPSNLAFSGHRAVMLFFVLSGFVLTLPALRGKQPPYGRFLLKRLIRIYVPYFAALLLALLGDALFHGPARSGSSWPHIWANHTWTAPIGFVLTLQHILLVGNYDWSQFNTAFWSLVFEMRISLLFPLLLWFVLRFRAAYALLLFLALEFSCRPLAVACASFLAWNRDPSEPFTSQTFITLHYAAIFLVGALLARHMQSIRSGLAHPRRWVPGLATAALLLVALAWIAKKAIGFHAISERVQALFLYRQLFDYPAVLAACALIVLALCFGPAQAVLRLHPVHHLGKVSYSLYLVHGTVLFALMHIVPEHAPAWFTVIVYVAATLLLTEAFYRLVEQPAIRASKRSFGFAGRRAEPQATGAPV